MTDSYAAYCVLDSGGEIAGDLAGLHACDVWNLSYRGMGVAVSILTKPIDDVVTGAIEHEKVVERLMQTHAVAPMRFPTIFGSGEAILAMLERHYSGFQDDLRRLRDRVEFGVRVLWPASSDFGLRTSDCGFVSLDQSAIRLGGSLGSETPGKLYMQERYRRHKHHQMLSDRAARFGRKLDAALSASAGEKRLRGFATDRFVFDGIYLVDKNRQVCFRGAFVDARSSEPGFRYLFSGPWPPYDFVTMPVMEMAGPANGTVVPAPVECPGLMEDAART